MTDCSDAPRGHDRVARARQHSGAAVVFVAGYGNSGPDHWQRRWHDALPGSVWIEQRAWETPERDSWVRALETQTRGIDGPILWVAHSLGCLVVTEWARRGGDLARVAGALLVAPPDPDDPAFPSVIRGFATPAAARLAFPAIVVASNDDPYATTAWTRRTAEGWGARLVELGPRGHINASSGLGNWPEGRELLSSLERVD